MLRLLPFDRFSLSSPHPVKALVDRLEAVTEPERPLFLAPREPYFFGDVSTSGFDLIRNIRARNSFTPKIEGEFGPDGGETHIHVTVSLQPAVAAFMIIWMSLVALIGGAAVVNALSNGNPNDDATILIPPLLLVFGWALTGFFWLDVRSARDELKEVLEASDLPAID